MMQNSKLNILFPVYNEEKRLARGIERTHVYLSEKTDIDYILTIVDNASCDATQVIAQRLCQKYPDHVSYIRIAEKGVGAAFRAGIAENQCELVGYMDIDLSTDIRHIPQVIKIFRSCPDVSLVNGSRWSRSSRTTGRKFYRNVTSLGLVWLLKAVFGMQASDAICGFKFFRRECAEALISQAGETTDGWFYLIELLLRAERSNTGIMELPVHWKDDTKNSTVNTANLILEYIKEIYQLRQRLKG